MELNGLSDDEVIINRKKYGTNQIEDTKSNSLLSLFIESFGDPIIKILLILTPMTLKRLPLPNLS